MRKLVIQFEFNLLHVHTLGITNSIAVIWAQRKGCGLGRKKIKHPVNNSPLAFHTSHSASLSSMGAWHTNTPGHLRWKAKSHCHCYHISQLQEALPWHTGEYGLILIPAYVWVCFHPRGQSGLMEFSDTGYKGYKRCLWRKPCCEVCCEANFSEGKPCLKTRTHFHSKGSVEFSATLS